MKFVLYPQNEQELDSIIDILKSEKCFYNCKIERHFAGIGILTTTLELYIYTDLEKFDFIKLLVEKRLQEIKKQNEEIQKLEKCYNLKCGRSEKYEIKVSSFGGNMTVKVGDKVISQSSYGHGAYVEFNEVGPIFLTSEENKKFEKIINAKKSKMRRWFSWLLR